MLTTACCPTARLMPVRTASLKPFFWTCISYWPTGSARTRKLPSSPVTASRAAPVSTLLTVTEAPEIVAPVESANFPEIEEPVCAHPATAETRISGSQLAGGHRRLDVRPWLSSDVRECVGAKKPDAISRLQAERSQPVRPGTENNLKAG